MELAELLTENGVDTIEELITKIKNEEKAEALKTYEEQKEGLRKQIKDLETIKASQGDDIGDLRKTIKEAEEKLNTLEEKPKVEEKLEDAGSLGKTEEQWGQENKARETALTEEDWGKLDNALSNADAETKKLATSSEEGRAAFTEAIIGPTDTSLQETFRRPKQEEKLSVAEQIKLGLGLIKQTTTPNILPTGSGFSQHETKKERKPLPAINPLIRSGSVKDLIKAAKGE